MIVSDPGVAVVIEDDDDVCNLLVAVFQQAGYQVYSATSGREGVDQVRRRLATLVTLDVGLPDIDGFEVLRRIRQFSDAYVVMVTGRNDELDMVTALHSGADDYIVKPFRPRELRARVAAMMRRPRQVALDDIGTELLYAVNEAGGAGASRRTMLQHNGLAIETETRTATFNGAPLGLTKSEYDLLQELLRSEGAIRTKADLVRIMRGDYHGDNDYISEADRRAVEVHIGNLRRKLREDPADPRWIVTVRGIGYRLAPLRAGQAVLSTGEQTAS